MRCGGTSWYQVTTLFGTQLYLAPRGLWHFGSLYCNEALGPKGFMKNMEILRECLAEDLLASTVLSISQFRAALPSACSENHGPEVLREQRKARAMLIQIKFS